MFIHKPHKLFKLQQITRSDGYRVYNVNGKHYQSITTVLGQYDRDKLDQWRKDIGNAEADRLSNRAKRRGKSLDSQVEDYLNNLPVEPSMLSLFPQMRPALDEHVTLVNNLQGQVYSHILEVAGSFDFLGEWDGIPSIIDFKTAKKAKEEAWIEKYFLQCAAYAMCLWEIYRIKVRQIVVLIGVDHEACPQIFIKDPYEYIEQVCKIIKKFK